jgi:predicted HTH transcriptional regulator
MDSTNSNNIDFGLPATDHYPNDEGQDLEYKSAQGGFPADFWRTYSAFANSFGGDIILGVSERKGKIKIEGLNAEQIALFQRLFWDNANNPNTISSNLLNNDDVNVIEADGKNLLVFSIPAATRT